MTLLMRDGCKFNALAIACCAALAVRSLFAYVEYKYSDGVYDDGVTVRYTVKSGTSVTLNKLILSNAFDAADFPWTFTHNGNEYTITEIAKEACKGLPLLTGTLSMPGGCKAIGGEYAFQGAGITRLILGEGVETIGNGAFKSCNSLSGSIVVPASATSVGSSMFEFAPGVRNLCVKGRETVASGEQTYTSLRPNSVLRVTSGGNYKTVLLGRNVMRAEGSTGTMFEKTADDVTVFARKDLGWGDGYSFGGTKVTVVLYGPGEELDLDIKGDTLTATPTTANALSNVVNNASAFKSAFGLDTVINITNSFPSAIGGNLFDLEGWGRFSVTTQEQLDRTLSAIPSDCLVVIDPTGATENLVVPAGRRLLVELGGGDAVKVKAGNGFYVIVQ